MTQTERAEVLLRFAFAVALAAWILAPAAQAQTDVDYRDRGDRYEGVRPSPVSGYDIELLSALVDSQEPSTALPARVKVRFFLDAERPVYLTVRELEVRHFYWLDRAKPSRPWGRGFGNEFAWETHVVLKKLSPPLALSELGAVARLDRPEPSADERVAPLILHHSGTPKTGGGYVFAFKTSTDARLVYRIYRDGNDTPVFTGPPLRSRGGRAFIVQWSASKAEGGPYRVVVEGYALDTNQPLHQTVRFTHHPQVP